MTVTVILNYAAALATAAVFLYWQVRDHSVHESTQRSGHNRPVQRAIRWLMPLLAALNLVQLLGLIQTSVPIPSGLRDTLFVFGHALFWLGAALAVWARETLGINWAHAAEYQIVPGQALITSGPYRHMRHPIYTGLLAMFLGIELALASWLLVLAILLVFLMHWQARKEEHLLLAAFGMSYKTYQQRTGMFLPRL